MLANLYYPGMPSTVSKTTCITLRLPLFSFLGYRQNTACKLEMRFSLFINFEPAYLVINCSTFKSLQCYIKGCGYFACIFLVMYLYLFLS